MPATDTIYGQVITGYDLEQAVLTHLQTWLPTCLAEIERQAGLAPQTIPVPPDPDNSFTAGLDFETWQAAYTPQLIVVVSPVGDPERLTGDGTYQQVFEIQVATVIQADDENTSRQQGQWYGAAVMMALLQHGSLGKFSTGNPVALKTVLAAYPALSFKETDDALGRRVVQSLVVVHSIIDGVVTESAGPATPPAVPYEIPGNWPEARSIVTTIDAQPL